MATLRQLLADRWQTTLRAEGGDALCLVELRGFEPLTACMPSRDPGKSSIMKPRITNHHTKAVVVTRGVLRGLVWLEVLPGCCRSTIVNFTFRGVARPRPEGGEPDPRMPLEHGLL
jgi:hypothetical protein